MSDLVPSLDNDVFIRNVFRVLLGRAPSDAEVDTEIEKFARASQRPAPAVRRMMEKSGDLDALRHGLREKKTLDLLIEHARITG